MKKLNIYFLFCVVIFSQTCGWTNKNMTKEKTINLIKGSKFRYGNVLLNDNELIQNLILKKEPVLILDEKVAEIDNDGLFIDHTNDSLIAYKNGIPMHIKFEDIKKIFFYDIENTNFENYTSTLPKYEPKSNFKLDDNYLHTNFKKPRIGGNKKISSISTQDVVSYCSAMIFKQLKMYSLLKSCKEFLRNLDSYIINSGKLEHIVDAIEWFERVVKTNSADKNGNKNKMQNLKELIENFEYFISFIPSVDNYKNQLNQINNQINTENLRYENRKNALEDLDDLLSREYEEIDIIYQSELKKRNDLAAKYSRGLRKDEIREKWSVNVLKMSKNEIECCNNNIKVHNKYLYKVKKKLENWEKDKSLNWAKKRDIWNAFYEISYQQSRINRLNDRKSMKMKPTKKSQFKPTILRGGGKRINIPKHGWGDPEQIKKVEYDPIKSKYYVHYNPMNYYKPQNQTDHVPYQKKEPLNNNNTNPHYFSEKNKQSSNNKNHNQQSKKSKNKKNNGSSDSFTSLPRGITPITNSPWKEYKPGPSESGPTADEELRERKATNVLDKMHYDSLGSLKFLEKQIYHKQYLEQNIEQIQNSKINDKIKLEFQSMHINKMDKELDDLEIRRDKKIKEIDENNKQIELNESYHEKITEELYNKKDQILKSCSSYYYNTLNTLRYKWLPYKPNFKSYEDNDILSSLNSLFTSSSSTIYNYSQNEILSKIKSGNFEKNINDAVNDIISQLPNNHQSILLKEYTTRLRDLVHTYNKQKNRDESMKHASKVLEKTNKYQSFLENLGANPQRKINELEKNLGKDFVYPNLNLPTTYNPIISEIQKILKTPSALEHFTQNDHLTFLNSVEKDSNKTFQKLYFKMDHLNCTSNEKKIYSSHLLLDMNLAFFSKIPIISPEVDNTDQRWYNFRPMRNNTFVIPPQGQTLKWDELFNEDVIEPMDDEKEEQLFISKESEVTTFDEFIDIKDDAPLEMTKDILRNLNRLDSDTKKYLANILYDVFESEITTAKKLYLKIKNKFIPTQNIIENNDKSPKEIDLNWEDYFNLMSALPTSVSLKLASRLASKFTKYTKLHDRLNRYRKKFTRNIQQKSFSHHTNTEISNGKNSIKNYSYFNINNKNLIGQNKQTFVKISNSDILKQIEKNNLSDKDTYTLYNDLKNYVKGRFNGNKIKRKYKSKTYNGKNWSFSTDENGNITKIIPMVPNSAKFSNKRLYKLGNISLDVENPNPQKRPGQIHVHYKNSYYPNKKFIYDLAKDKFIDAPDFLNIMLKKNTDFKKAVEKGLKYLGQ